MPEKLTWNEIKKRYPDEWVVLVDYRVDGEDIVEGAVIDHGRIKKEVYRRLRDVQEDCAVEYTGRIRHGLVLGVYAIDLDQRDRT